MTNTRVLLATEDTALSTRLEHLHRVLQDTRRHYASKSVELFLAGDFNRHDQLWGGDAFGANPAQGEGMPIIDFMVDHQLESLLPRGTITYEGSLKRCTTINLALASTSLANARARCDVYPEEHGSDHRPIETHFDLDPPLQDLTPRLLFEQARWDAIRKEISVRLVVNMPRYGCYSQARIAIQLDRYQKDLGSV
jgi:Endonuclease-reverse transcriptase